MIRNWKNYKKFYVALLGGIGVGIAGVVADGDLTVSDIATFVVAVLTAFGVLGVKNRTSF